MRKRQLLAQGLQYSGTLAALDHLWWGSDRLTVLAYHRITDVNAPDFYGLAPNVSASVALFDAQMQFVKQHFNVISLDDVRAFLLRGRALPARPLLITFDDGYRDNYDNAFPVLKRHNLPAVIFVVTGRMDDPSPLWWDRCAQVFRESHATEAELPVVGVVRWQTMAEKRQAAQEYIEAIKHFSPDERDNAIQQAQAALGVSSIDTPALFFDWDAVQELVDNGVACQPHTVTHPILTTIPPEVAAREVQQSRDHLREATGQVVDTFAYPNGTTADYNVTLLKILRDAGYQMAVTLLPGPAALDAVKRHPLQIRRIFLSHQDTMAIFQMKIYGIPALRMHQPYLTEGA